MANCLLIGSVSCCVVYLVPSDLVIVEVVPSKGQGGQCIADSYLLHLLMLISPSYHCRFNVLVILVLACYH